LKAKANKIKHDSLTQEEITSVKQLSQAPENPGQKNFEFLSTRWIKRMLTARSTR